MSKPSVPLSRWGDQGQVVDEAEPELVNGDPRHSPPLPAHPRPGRGGAACQMPPDSPWGFWSSVPSGSKEKGSASPSPCPDKGLILRRPEEAGQSSAGVSSWAASAWQHPGRHPEPADPRGGEGAPPPPPASAAMCTSSAPPQARLGCTSLALLLTASCISPVLMGQLLASWFLSGWLKA